MNITTLILIITVVVSFFALQKESDLRKLIFNPYTVKRNNEWHRFLTHAFIHADYVHLGVNMYVFWMFGSFIEEVIGRNDFILLYLGGIIFASIPSYLKHQNNSHYNSLGASGAVASVVFAFVLINPSSMLYLMAIIPMPAWIFGILYLVYEAYMDKKANDHIAHDAHFYGAIWGIIVTGVSNPNYFLSFFDKIF